MAAANKKVIITCAVTGSIHTPTMIRRILEELSLEIATPMEARQRLALKGMEKVGF